MLQRITVLFILTGLLVNCAGTGETTRSTVVEVDTIPEPAQIELEEPSYVQPTSEEILTQAKRHYANALISVYDNDTTGARFEFEQSLEALRTLQDVDSLEPWAEDESRLLTQKITEDYVEYLEKNKSEQAGPNPTSLHERISLLEPIEEVESESGDFEVLFDKEGHIPIIKNARVERIIDFFQTRGREDFQIWLNRIPKYKETFTSILAQYDLPPELFYLALIESGLNPKAYSYAHASGPWQFISSTGKFYGLDRNWWIDERRDPIKSTHAAARYLSKLYEEFGDWYLAMAAYNAGERRIWRAIRREDTRDFWSLHTLPRQTRNYIPTFMAATIIAHHPEEYGFKIEPQEKYMVDMVKVERSYDLFRIAEAMNVDASELRRLNPELRRGVTPTGVESYTLNLPVGTRDKFIAMREEIPEAGQREHVSHIVSYGETLSLIARRYHVSVTSIVRANNIRNSHRIKVGQRLLIPAPGTSSGALASRSGSTTKKVPGRTALTYVVKRGDTLGEIAEAYNTRASSIRSWNGLRYGEYIYPGQHLTIHVPENSSLASATKTVSTKDGEYKVYTVQPGDTLWDIARKHGVEVDQLRAWNMELASGYIKPGDKVKIMTN